MWHKLCLIVFVAWCPFPSHVFVAMANPGRSADRHLPILDLQVRMRDIIEAMPHFSHRHVGQMHTIA